MTTESEWGPWTPHDGGPCPIPDEKVESYQFGMRDGSRMAYMVPYSGYWTWRDRREDRRDIISYRTKRKQL